MRRLREVGVAFPTGTCFGVRRALDLAERLLSVSRVFALHPLIHNERALKPFYEKGFVVVNGVSNIPDGAVVLLSAHGTQRDVLTELKKRPVVLVDATCPLVKRVHEVAAEMLSEGRTILVVGDPDHVEVKALISHLPSGRYVMWKDHLHGRFAKLGVVFQTTYAYRSVSDIAGRLVEYSDDIRLVVTICFATRGRQSVFDRLQKGYEAAVIVGGKNSANTARLYRIALNRFGRVWWVESPDELDEDILGVRSVLIVGGASTPLRHIAEVYSHIKAMIE